MKVSSKDQPGKFLQVQTARRYTAKQHKGVDRLGIQALSKVEHKMVELKAKVDNLDPILEKLIRLTTQRIGTFQQTDIYFAVPEGRLKLRKTRDHDKAELVYYERENVADVKESSVFILKTQNPAQFENLLKKVLRTKTVVEKVREIYLYQGTQVHLDTVESLGTFVEFERRTSPNPDTVRKNRHVLEKLMLKLGIDSEMLVKLSYSDLVEQSKVRSEHGIE